ncbi:uracil-DNA glycosylase-like protein [Mycotypha africana]|uniref:uracil-DNA glycosylase-like protein n=1 Tax=Mycotypha africana TaxID=64632 RepID=UPI0022FFDD4A|nr:uracil-DNA glycosylase-like protein [Mycotypha africana]KAI8973318.1 uracil-DNA glycosylase-like protein [Mycotypha africana]
MLENKKRQREEEPAATSNKKQTTLLSMFKPVVAKSQTSPGIGSNTEEGNVKSLDVPSAKKKKTPRELLGDKNINDETLKLLDLELKTLNYEWLKVLAPELVKPYFLKLKQYLKAQMDAKKVIFPPADQVYSWSHFTPPSKVEVVILGQDPYHNYNQAHGLCFSVVKGVKVPPSLVNMYKALKIDYPDFVAPQHGYLVEWAKRGVLLLNTSLTVEAHKAGSHANQGWEQFTDAVINYLNEKKSNLVFMLWGSHAQKKGARINKSVSSFEPKLQLVYIVTNRPEFFY